MERAFGARMRPRRIEAIRLTNPRDRIGSCFSGCCWGALTSMRLRRNAHEIDAAHPGANPWRSAVSRQVRLPLSDARAHTTRLTALVGFFGGPHAPAFWTQVLHDKKPPAEALFEAKRDFLRACHMDVERFSI